MYDVNKIKEYIKLAQEAVKDEAEPFRSEAFKIIFAKLLESSHKSDERNLEHLESNVKSDLSLDQKISDFAKSCNITMRELKDVLYITDDVVYLIAHFEATEAEKQVIAAQCILTAFEFLFNMEWLESSKLMKCIDLSGIGGLDHLARNLRIKSKIFRIQGRGKGKSLEYKISGYGRLQAFQIIHDLAKGEEV